MERRRFWLGMLAMVLVFGMAVIGCDKDSKELINWLDELSIVIVMF